ncbi:hypothetical protein PIB30_000477 [Stylosanthes scabra]|uniref:Uncharacterized protein n=1 Tax=Stylosanthes scabra TaxID=79078 RepID=A0ABU6V1S1_9FABA|nr:hypothetical protein [Stylosanthes scabra]
MDTRHGYGARTGSKNLNGGGWRERGTRPHGYPLPSLPILPYQFPPPPPPGASTLEAPSPSAPPSQQLKKKEAATVSPRRQNEGRALRFCHIDSIVAINVDLVCSFSLLMRKVTHTD